MKLAPMPMLLFERPMWQKRLASIKFLTEKSDGFFFVNAVLMISRRIISSMVYRVSLVVVLGSLLGSPESGLGQEPAGDVETIYEATEDAGGDPEVIFERSPAGDGAIAEDHVETRQSRHTRDSGSSEDVELPIPGNETAGEQGSDPHGFKANFKTQSQSVGDEE